MKQTPIKQKKLLIVESDDILSKFLQVYLSRSGYQVECLATGEGLPKYLEKSRADLVVMDVLLPDRSGIYWLKWLREYHPYTRIILTSVKIGEDDRLQGLECGAVDYVIKPFHDKELLIRVNHALRDSTVFSDEKIISLKDMKIDLVNQVVMKLGEQTHLTTLEANILKLLHMNAGTYVSREDIMLQVKGASYHPLDRSIDIHINKLRKKIEDNPSSPAYIKTIRGKGYSFNLHGSTVASVDESDA